MARYVDLRFCVVDGVHESAYWLMPGRAVRLQRFRWRVSSVTYGDDAARKPRWAGGAADAVSCRAAGRVAVAVAEVPAGGIPPLRARPAYQG